jgi:hypothetical protein
MIHHDHLQAIRVTHRFRDFLFPAYGGRSLSDIAPTVLSRFGVETGRPLLAKPVTDHAVWQKPVLLHVLIDGLGYDHVIRHYKTFPFLRGVARHGDIYPLTSVFPSTTSAALTGVHTGLTPQEHGIPEWNVYFEEYESLVQTILFKTWDMPNTDGLLDIGAKPELLFKGETVYERLERAGVPAYAVIKKDYVGSVYSSLMHQGARLVPFEDHGHMAGQLGALLEERTDATYVFLYWSEVDGAAHRFGPGSDEHVAAIEQCCAALQAVIDGLSPEAAARTGLMVSSDHGHVSILGDEIIHLNDYPLLEECFQRSPSGKKIPPWGSPHDVFLAVQPQRADEVIRLLSDDLVGKAEVLRSSEALSQGLFGLYEPSEAFLRRIGNVMILPHSGYHVWYDFTPGVAFGQRGIHGGLTEEEMIIPFMLSPCDRLRAGVPR